MSQLETTVRKVKSRTSRYLHRPNGAFKLLVYLLYSKYTFIEKRQNGYIKILYISKLARILGTQSASINKWLLWLLQQGYISDLNYSTCRRAVHMRIREVSRK